MSWLKLKLLNKISDDDSGNQIWWIWHFNFGWVLKHQLGARTEPGLIQGTRPAPVHCLRSASSSESETVSQSWFVLITKPLWGVTTIQYSRTELVNQWPVGTVQIFGGVMILFQFQLLCWALAHVSGCNGSKGKARSRWNRYEKKSIQPRLRWCQLSFCSSESLDKPSEEADPGWSLHDKTIANVSLKTSVTAQTSDISRQNCAELKTLILWHIASIFYIYSSACTATGDSCLKRSQHSWHETTTTGSLFRFFGHESQNTDFTAFLRPVDSDDPLHAALELFPASTQTALDRAFSLIGFASASKCLWIQSLFYNLVW